MLAYDAIKARVPKLPGCYLWKDGSGKILYVGKAKDLRSRVHSYFAKDLSAKTQLLMSKAVDIEVIVTSNEVEALLLENTLIKQHQPQYNIDLKRTERYAFILVTDEKWPRVLTVRKKTRKGTLYGPYADGYLRVQTIRLVTDVCKLRICTVLPKKPCLQYHIGKCDAPCISNITHEEYLKNVERAKAILSGRTEAIARELQAQMHAFSKNREFEKAAEKRNQLELLSRITDYEQLVDMHKRFDQDVFATITDGSQLRVEAFAIKRGVLRKRERFKIDLLSAQTFSDFLRAYYAVRDPPGEIITDAELDDKRALEAYFSQRSKRNVEIVIPVRGEKKKLLDLARQNVAVSLQEDHPQLAELARVLKLKTLPRVIECFDISHLHGTGVVAASVRYVDGEPDPNEYRRYEIRTVVGQDDFRSLHEAVLRRCTRLKADGILPDLFVIDGGKEQLKFSRKAMAEAGVDVPVIALAKKDEEIYLPYLSIPVRLPKNNEALKLLMRIRDATHRFAIKYQRTKRKPLKQ